MQSRGALGRKDGTTPNATRVRSSVSAIQKRSRASELRLTPAVHVFGPNVSRPYMIGLSEEGKIPFRLFRGPVQTGFLPRYQSQYNRWTEVVMTLTPELKQAVENAGDAPVRVEDPETHTTYLIVREDASPALTSRACQGTQPAVVAEILSRASSLKAPEELEEVAAGLLALRARRLAPVLSSEETRLLLAINEGVPVEFTDRVASLIEKRDDCTLTLAENSGLAQLADEVERRGVERIEALSRLAELRGVSLRELMKSLGVAAGDHG
jgi:hypothetical protein